MTPEQHTESPWIVAWVLTPVVGALGWLGRWVLGRQMQSIDANTAAVTTMTTEITRLANRFEDHLEKQESLGERFVEGAVETRVRLDQILERRENP